MAWANDRVIGCCTMNVCGWGGGGGGGWGGETRSGVVMAKLLHTGGGGGELVSIWKSGTCGV